MASAHSVLSSTLQQMRNAFEPERKQSNSSNTSEGNRSRNSIAGSTFGSRFATRARAAVASANTLLTSAGNQIDTVATEQMGFNLRGLLSGLTSGVEATSQTRLLVLQPGWAVKRYLPAAVPDSNGNPFDAVISINGSCAIQKDLSTASRTQRALLSLARRFAALPPIGLPDTEPRGETVDRRVSNDPSYVRRPSRSSSVDSFSGFPDNESLQAAHTNLDTRLTPFLSSSAPNVDLSIRVYQKLSSRASDKPASSLLKEFTITTDASGGFRRSLVIPWADLRESVPRLRGEDEMTLRSGEAPEPVELIASISMSGDNGSVNETNMGSGRESCLTGTEDTSSQQGRVGGRIHGATPLCEVPYVVAEPSGIRVLSDIDDTIKHSDILAGPREVFRNVFCRPLKDLLIPGMDTLFHDLSASGVNGFHYVSNSPLGLLSSIKEFLHLHGFPRQYSLALKSYDGRSLMSSLFETPSDRKRNAVYDLLSSFSESKFILIGDSGEQDLELYCDAAIHHPGQIMAVLIRDITSGRASEIKRQPLTQAPTIPAPSEEASSDSIDLLQDQVQTGTTSTSPLSSGAEPSSQAGRPTSVMDELQELTAAQQKVLKLAAHWEERVRLAKRTIPEGIPLLFFRDPSEIKDKVVELVEQQRGRR